jgi:hypothetical protein
MDINLVIYLLLFIRFLDFHRKEWKSAKFLKVLLCGLCFPRLPTGRFAVKKEGLQKMEAFRTKIIKLD